MQPHYFNNGVALQLNPSGLLQGLDARVQTGAAF